MKTDKVFIPERKPHEAYKTPIKIEAEPKHVWVCTEEPDLDMKPKHRINAFLEDRLHDWDYRNGNFYYYGAAALGKVWLFIEYE